MKFVAGMNEVPFIPVKRHSSSGSTESRPTDSDRNVVGRATLCGAAMFSALPLACLIVGSSIGRGGRPRPQQSRKTQRIYGLSNGIKASRYRHTKNNSRAVNTSAGGKPSGAISA